MYFSAYFFCSVLQSIPLFVPHVWNETVLTMQYFGKFEILCSLYEICASLYCRKVAYSFLLLAFKPWFRSLLFLYFVVRSNLQRCSSLWPLARAGIFLYHFLVSFSCYDSCLHGSILLASMLYQMEQNMFG